MNTYSLFLLVGGVRLDGLVIHREVDQIVRVFDYFTVDGLQDLVVNFISIVFPEAFRVPMAVFCENTRKQAVLFIGPWRHRHFRVVGVVCFGSRFHHEKIFQEKNFLQERAAVVLQLRARAAEGFVESRHVDALEEIAIVLVRKLVGKEPLVDLEHVLRGKRQNDVAVPKVACLQHFVLLRAAGVGVEGKQ